MVAAERWLVQIYLFDLLNLLNLLELSHLSLLILWHPQYLLDLLDVSHLWYLSNLSRFWHLTQETLIVEVGRA